MACLVVKHMLQIDEFSACLCLQTLTDWCINVSDNLDIIDSDDSMLSVPLPDH